MIAAIGAAAGATLTLDAQTLRARYDEHRDTAGNQARALATFALGLARHQEYGSVGASKKQLAERMANLILDDLLRRGAEVVSAERPIVAMLVSIFRVT